MGAGYLLGRTRKMRLALTLAGAAMARRSSGGATQELLERGTSLLRSSPELAGITDTVRQQLMGAARAAAVTAASNRIDALNARLQQRAAISEPEEELPEAEEELRDETPDTGEEEYPEETTEGDEQGYADEDIEDEYPEEEEEEDEYPEEEQDEYPEEEQEESPEVEAELVEDESEGSQDESEESPEPAPARRTASTTRRRAGESRFRKSGDRTAASPGRRRIRAEAQEAPIRRTRR
ncbi:hypothetical protein IU459_06430 [Nocardia amamiensis]|uniref:Uncharacterized protein n=1 Tax=Nocardia amamiensis TaxID=404578 RepID=A0ABS0CQN3_9NOCA|nr:hypothetical protein [Nocardia amamiensis]MBF6297179.1 hypothetical protein [Nocardia amamiensis]